VAAAAAKAAAAVPFFDVCALPLLVLWRYFWLAEDEEDACFPVGDERLLLGLTGGTGRSPRDATCK